MFELLTHFQHFSGAKLHVILSINQRSLNSVYISLRVYRHYKLTELTMFQCSGGTPQSCRAGPSSPWLFVPCKRMFPITGLQSLLDDCISFFLFSNALKPRLWYCRDSNRGSLRQIFDTKLRIYHWAKSLLKCFFFMLLSNYGYIRNYYLLIIYQKW